MEAVLKAWTGAVVAAALAVGMLAFALWPTGRPRHSARSAAPIPGARLAASRRYAKPLVTLQDVGVDEEEADEGDDQPTTDDEADTEFKPRADLPTLELKLPFDWSADPFNDRNWFSQLHMLRMTNRPLARYETTHDAGSYREALAIALDWWRHHKDRAALSPQVWEGMTAGVRAAHVAYLLDRAFAGELKLAQGEEAALIAMTNAHVLQLRAPEKLIRSNHGLFQIRGLMLLCRVLGNAGACSGGDDYVQTAMRELLDLQFTADGVHREHSPSYHRLAIDTLSAFARASGTGVFKEIADRLERARAVTPWFVFPGGRIAALGDSEGVAPVDPPPNQRCSASASPSAPCAEVASMTRDGYAVVRSPWAADGRRAFMLIMTGSFNMKSHKHADDLSFELMDFGQMLFIDAGKYSYERNNMRRFVVSARAHNTVGLDQPEIGINLGTPHASALEPTEEAGDVYTLRGRIEHPGLFAQARRIDYSPGRYLLVHDELSSDTKRNYESYLHLYPKLKPSRQGAGFTVPLADGRVMRIESLSRGCSASSARGVYKRHEVQGWATRRYRQMTPASALTFNCPGKNRSIALLVSFDEEGRKAGLAAHSRGPS